MNSINRYNLEKYLETIPEDAYPNELKENIKLISFSDLETNKPTLYGSMIYRMQKYNADADIFQQVSLYGTREEVANHISNRIKEIVKNILNSKSNFFLELKAGLNPIFNPDKLGYMRNGIPIIDKNILKNMIMIGSKEKLFDNKDLKILNTILFKEKLDQNDFDMLHSIIRNKYILRWNENEILKGYKIIGNKKLSLSEAILYESPLKLDMVGILDGRFIEITNFVLLSNVIDGLEHSISLPSKEAFKEETLKDDIEKLYYSDMYYSPFKMIKRLYSLLRKTEIDNDILQNIIPLLTSDISELYQIKSHIEILGVLKEKKYPYDINFLINREIDSIKLRLSKIIEIGNEKLKVLLKLLDNLKGKYNKKIIDDIINILSDIINSNTIEFMSKIKINPPPYIVMPNLPKYNHSVVRSPYINLNTGGNVDNLREKIRQEWLERRNKGYVRDLTEEEKFLKKTFEKKPKIVGTFREFEEKRREKLENQKQYSIFETLTTLPKEYVPSFELYEKLSKKESKIFDKYLKNNKLLLLKIADNLTDTQDILKLENKLNNLLQNSINQLTNRLQKEKNPYIAKNLSKDIFTLENFKKIIKNDKKELDEFVIDLLSPTMNPKLLDETKIKISNNLKDLIGIKNIKGIPSDIKKTVEKIFKKIGEIKKITPKEKEEAAIEREIFEEKVNNNELEDEDQKIIDDLLEESLKYEDYNVATELLKKFKRSVNKTVENIVYELKSNNLDINNIVDILGDDLNLNEENITRIVEEIIKKNKKLKLGLDNKTINELRDNLNKYNNEKNLPTDQMEEITKDYVNKKSYIDQLKKAIGLWDENKYDLIDLIKRFGIAGYDFKFFRHFLKKEFDEDDNFVDDIMDKLRDYKNIISKDLLEKGSKEKGLVASIMFSKEAQLREDLNHILRSDNEHIGDEDLQNIQYIDFYNKIPQEQEQEQEIPKLSKEEEKEEELSKDYEFIKELSKEYDFIYDPNK